MDLGICGDPDCPNLRRVKELEAELETAKRWGQGRLDCAMTNRKGERCILSKGHAGQHEWPNGD